MVMKIDRIQIEYDLKFSTSFHCGTGIRAGLIDRTIVRDSGGYLYVPGSTFKGVLRERCEQLARMYEELDEDMRELIASPHDDLIALRGLGQKMTMITRIFGSHIHPGQLCFDDARQTDDDKRQYDSQDDQGRYKNLQTDLYTQVRLNRPTRTAVEGALYTSEFGVRDFIFKGSISGWLECIALDGEADAFFASEQPSDDGPTYSLLLLLAGLSLVDRLGGNKSTGKGQCECKVTKLAVNGTNYKEEQWKAWLEHLGALSLYSYVASQEGEA